MKTLITLFNDYAEGVSALCTLCTLIGAAIAEIGNRYTNKKKNKNLEEQKKKWEEERTQYKKRIAELEGLLNDNIVKIDDSDCYYWKTKQEKICPVCWSVNHKIVPVHNQNNGYYKCPICKGEGVYDRKIVNDVKDTLDKAILDFYDND